MIPVSLNSQKTLGGLVRNSFNAAPNRPDRRTNKLGVDKASSCVTFYGLLSPRREWRALWRPEIQKIERRTKPLLASLNAGADLAGQRMRKLLYKALSVVIVQMGVVLFVVPLMGIGLLFFWEWLVSAHWVRATLCTASYAFDDIRGAGPSLETHEFSRCPVNTGLDGPNFILHYFINDLSLFASVPIISAMGLVITAHLWARCVLNEH